MTASQYLADGCELLLDVYGPGVVGGILIPILGAVPDGMMIFMSGSRGTNTAEIQEQLAVGVGTLVGSTIMLTTVPWAVGIYLSRRKLGGIDGRALSREKKVEREIFNRVTGETKKKTITVKVPVVPKSFSWTKVGATALSTTPKGAIAMMLTASLYLIIQLPAIFFGGESDHGAKKENTFAAVGFFLTLLCFFMYLYWVYTDEDAVELIIEKQRRLTLEWHVIDGYHNMRSLIKGADPFMDSETIFELFDKNQDGTIDFEEMCAGWASIGYSFDDEQSRMSFNMLDSDCDGHISRSEFINWIEDYLLPQFIISQPGTITENTALPSTIPHDVAQSIQTFIGATDSKELQLILSKDQRYAIHMWASNISFPSFYLHTHSEDVVNHATKQVTRVFFLRKVSGQRPLTNLRPTPRPLVSGVAPWACASSTLIEYFRSHVNPTLSPIEADYLVMDQLFSSIDTKDNGVISLDQVQKFMRSYNVALSPSQIKFQFYSRDADYDHFITKSEFRGLLEGLCEHRDTPMEYDASPAFKIDSDPILSSSRGENNGLSHLSLHGSVNDEVSKIPLLSNNMASYSTLDKDSVNEDGDEDDDDEQSENEEHANLTLNQKFYRALLFIACGAIAVTLFSDPMCEVISSLGGKVGVDPFYISFIVTPLASNASEVFAALRFSKKKTDVTMGLTLSSLYGAATMNNTFCLSVLLGLVWLRQLAWTYTAEVIGVLITTVVVGIIGLRQTVKMWHAAIVFCMFPLSIIIIWTLNKYDIDNWHL